MVVTVPLVAGRTNSGHWRYVGKTTGTNSKLCAVSKACDLGHVHCTSYAGNLNVLILHTWDFRFSQRCWWRYKSCGMLHCIDSLIWYVTTESANLQYYCFICALMSQAGLFHEIFCHVFCVYLLLFMYNCSQFCASLREVITCVIRSTVCSALCEPPAATDGTELVA
jgi:hypothetical protein